MIELHRTVPAIAAALMLPQVGSAQSALEEIVVTAKKREQSVQEVPLSIAAFDEKSYRDLTRGTLDGLAAQITNLQAYAANTFLQTVHIRGIGLNEFQGQYDSPIAQHIDEVYVSKPWMNARRQYDIARVEVLKGPQGTLFGRNTTGGAVNYYTNAPSQEFDASIEFGGDEYERYRVTGMLNGGLTDRLSARLSFNSEFGNGGPQYNLYTHDEHGAPDLFDARGQLLWDGDALDVRVMVHGGRDKSEKAAWKGPGIFNFGAPGYCPQALSGRIWTDPSACAKFAGFAALAGFPDAEFEPKDVFTINVNTPPKVDDTFYGGYVRLGWDMGGGTELTSITGYEYFERIHNDDSQSDIFDSTSTHYYDKINQFTQEVRLTGSANEKWHYVAGLFYEHDDLDQVDGSDLSEQPLPGITPPFANQFFDEAAQKLETAAAFLNIEFDVTDKLTIDAGARYSHDKIAVDHVLLGIGNLPQTGKERRVTPCLITTFVNGPIGSEACPFLGPIAPLYSDDRTDQNSSWLLGFEWKAATDVMVYGNLTTGYRAGGYSLPFAGAATTFDPEKIFAEEAGIKSRWLDGRLQVNAALFHFQYDDVQVNVDDPVSPLVPITRNIGKQDSWGAELDVELAPVEHWLIKQGLGWLDAEFKDTDRVITTYAGPVPLEGKRPVNSPELTYNGLVQYRRPVFTDLETTLGVDYRWVDERYLEATNQPFDKADAYWVANARAAIGSADGRWQFTVYGTNIFDEKYLTYINNIAFFTVGIYGEQRTLGATFSYNFR